MRKKINKKILLINQKASNAIGIIDTEIRKELLNINHNFDFLELREKGNTKFKIILNYLFNIINILQKIFKYKKIYFSWENPYVIFAKFFYPGKKIYMGVMHIEDYWGKSLIGKLIFKSIYKYITISKFTKNQLFEYGINEDKIFVNYIGISDQFYPEKIDKFKDFKYILYVGTELKRKNIKNLLLALKKVLLKYPNLKLIKIGKSVQPEYITDNLVKELSLEKNIIFKRTFISEEDLRKYYSNAICYVSVATLEGFGMTVPEAMACGCPVVFSNIPPFKEIVGNNGIIVDPNNIDEIANGITKYIENQSFREQMSLNGIKSSKKFNWKNSAKNLINFFDKENKSNLN